MSDAVPGAAAKEREQVAPGWRRWEKLYPLLLILCALIYYGSYWRCWFNPHDEGGTAVLLASRLLNGERPIVDVVLNYNVGWFYPLVALFKFSGPHYLLTRAWFFLLSTCAALVAFRLLRIGTGSRLIALFGGLLVVVFPGSQFKNYIPLLAVLNTMLLVQFLRREDRLVRTMVRDAVMGGLVLGLTFLVRIELGILFTLLWVGALAWILCDARLAIAQRFRRSALALLIVAFVTIATQFPAYVDARSRGFDQAFVAQYSRWVSDLSNRARAVFHLPPVRATGAGARDGTRALAPQDRRTLPRTEPSAIWSSPDLQRRVLGFLTYAPLIVYAAFLAWCAVRLITTLWRGEFHTAQPSFIALVALGGSLAVFPQFFFFRPDRPHLAEFMPLYMVASLLTLMAIWRERRTVWQKSWRAALTIFVAVQCAIFGWFAMQHPSAGTIAARTKRKILFEGANGARVLVQKKEYEFLENVRRTITAHSRPGDFLICYPYQPGFNVMTDRPTYLKDVYVDNASQPRGWVRDTLRDLNERRPAVICIDDRAINGVDASRFSRWAKPVFNHIVQNYTLRGTFNEVAIYSLPDAPASPP